MTHSLLTSLAWGMWRRSEVVAGDSDDKDSREAVYVQDLDPEWIHALETADYSHLPKLTKINA
jgi:hypothetical protein